VERLSFQETPPPQSFEHRVIVLNPGGEHPYDEDEWRDALVVVERGSVELESRSGVCRPFLCGDVLWLTGLPLRLLRNRDAEPAVLSVISRR
jgi:hypothetical protein